MLSLSSVKRLVYVQFNFSRTFCLCLELTTVEPRVYINLQYNLLCVSVCVYSA
jgi:hypothetical protein